MTIGRNFLIAQNDDPELLEWLSKAHTEGGGFLSAIAKAALVADHENYPLMRPLLSVLRLKYPAYEPSDAVKQEIRARSFAMTVHQLLNADLPEIAPSDKHILAAFLEFLAERAEDARLPNGRRLLDRTDFEMWLRNIAQEVRK